MHAIFIFLFVAFRVIHFYIVSQFILLMANTFSQILNHQRAPDFLFRFPRIIFVYYLLNHLTALRMKYTRRAIRQVVTTMPLPKRIVDAGCGMGDFLFTVREFQNGKQLIGLDVSQSNIDVCNCLMETLKKKNMKFVCSDLNAAEIPPQQDLIMCIAVIMLMSDDKALLRKFRDALAPHGRLLLYAAVNYRRTLTLYKWFAQKKGFDYDEVIGRPQTYNDEILEQRIKECGFVIEEKRHSFGIAAATMFEISAIFEWLFKTWHPVLTLLLIPFYLIFYPLYLLSMFIDYHGTRATGNGVMIIAKKA